MIKLYIKGFKKIPSCILGEIKVFGLFEVLETKIKDYKIEGAEAVMNNLPECIYAIIKGEYHYGYGYEIIDELKFFLETLPGSRDAWGERYDEDNNLITIMYDPSKLLVFFDRVLEIFDDIPYKLLRMDKVQQKNEILKIKNILEITSKNSGIIYFGYYE